MNKLNIDNKKCVHCGACTAACGERALQINDPQWILSYDASRCTGCNTCLAACPLRAITASSL